MTETKTKILIVEDDIFMMKLYSKVFALEGFEVTTAVNGEEGLLHVYKENPTVILADIMMPEMNGLELLGKVKADPMTKKIPVIMLTNLAGKTESDNAIAKGAIKYIVKSEHDPKEVVAIVKEVLASLKI
ncbi:MAG: response regulator [Candidatus Roizmanbacteria bacterium]|nr:response regulator [Candidatus Roizmanbacteria bacterium]